jgi:hypothetical protein
MASISSPDMTATSPQTLAPHLISHRIVARAIAAIGLLGIGLIHLLDLPGKIKETPYLGVTYIVLIAGTLVASAWLAVRDDRRAWVLGGGIALLTLIGFVINRTVGMPHATEDIGNWLEPLGLASLFVEALVVLVSGMVLADRAARPTGP